MYVQRLSAAQLSVTVLPTACSADTGGFRSSYLRLEKKLVLTPRSVLHVWRCGLGLVTGLLLSLFPFPTLLYSCFDNLGFFSWLFSPTVRLGEGFGVVPAVGGGGTKAGCLLPGCDWHLNTDHGPTLPVGAGLFCALL